MATGRAGPFDIVPSSVTRLRRAISLDPAAFAEVRFDANATASSVLIAALSMALLGVGGWLWWLQSDLANSGEVLFKSVVLGTLFSLTLWLVWLLVTYGVLQRMGVRPVHIEELLRTAGLATVPLSLGLLMALPVLSFAFGLIAIGAWLLTTQVAIERATPARGSQALIANLAGFAVWVIGMSLLATAGDPLAPGPFLAESVWSAVA